MFEVALDAEADLYQARSFASCWRLLKPTKSRSRLRLKRQSLFSKRKTQPAKMAAKRRKRAKTPR
jgi:hypothetical protein